MGSMMMAAIAPKSDQLNAEDLIGGDMIVTIKDVKIDLNADQKVSLVLEGHSRVYRPCKTMGRAIVACWGGDETAYIGRSLLLYRDHTAKWGGVEVGGIRIRAASHIDRPVIAQLTEKRGQRRPWTIQPLAMPNAQPQQRKAEPQQPAQINSGLLSRANEAAARGTDALRAMWETELDGEEKAALKAEMTRLKSVAADADRVRAEDSTFGLTLTPEQIAAEAAAHAEIEASRAQEGGDQN